MKKKVFLVSALVAIAMSAMFIGCKKSGGNEPDSGLHGCVCTWFLDGAEVESQKLTSEEIKLHYDGASCSQLANILNRDAEPDESIECDSY